MPSSRQDGGVHVLRLCSVFEPGGPPDARATRFDPIGGMQNHTAALTRCLDAQGCRQMVLTSRLAGPAGATRVGRAAVVSRRGLPVPWLRQLWALAALPGVLRARHVDVVHAHQGEDLATLLLARLAARRHACPLVVTVHCSVGHTLAGTSLRARVLASLGGRLERATLRSAAAVVVLTRRSASAVEADGVPAERIATIPSGFEPAVFTAAPAPATATAPGTAPAAPQTGRVRIGYVGRLAPQKRVDVLVRAFGRMREPADLVLVGDGPERARVAALVAAGPAAQRTTLTGFVEHAQVPAVLAGLDVLVLPSAYEEMGSVLVEAMVSGLPVVASAVGGIPDVVRPGETGLLVPPGDEAALAAALDRLVADPQLRARLAAGGRARARDYAWPRLAARVAAVYREVLPPADRQVPAA